MTSYNYSPSTPLSLAGRASTDEQPLLAGSLAAFNLSALLSLLNIQKQTGELTMRNYGFVAQAWVAEGELVDALLGRVHGLPALFQAMSWNEGGFTFTGNAAIERTITLTLPVVQVRAALWLDRWRNVLQTIPSLGNCITVHNSPRGDVIIKPYQWSVLTRVVGGPVSVADLAHALKEDPLAVTRICVELVEMSLCQVLPPLAN